MSTISTISGRLINRSYYPEITMKVLLHSQRDWCHLCGKRTLPSLDIDYPENAEHPEVKGGKYIRICRNCIKYMANSFPRPKRGKIPREMIMDYMKSLRRLGATEEEAFEDARERLKGLPDFNETVLKHQIHFLWEQWSENVGVEKEMEDIHN